MERSNPLFYGDIHEAGLGILKLSKSSQLTDEESAQLRQAWKICACVAFEIMRRESSERLAKESAECL
jgi:hypothetical protein